MSRYNLDGMRRLRESWGGACVMCGNDRDDRLEFAHLPGKPTGLEGRGRGLPQRYCDIRKHPDCYILVCVSCHTELDDRGGGDRPHQPRKRGRFSTVARDATTECE